WQATDTMATREVHHWNGRFTEVTQVRYLNAVLLRGGDDALAVNWFEIIVVNATTGEQLYHNSCITNHRLTAANVVEVAQSGRGRWKIENNNVLKTKGYHLEHNFGHGKQYGVFCPTLSCHAGHEGGWAKNPRLGPLLSILCRCTYAPPWA